jgi:hypothetical protein
MSVWNNACKGTKFAKNNTGLTVGGLKPSKWYDIGKKHSTVQ